MCEIEDILKSREAIVEHTKGSGAGSGSMDCPVCGNKNSLNFCVYLNKHIHAECETDDCVYWIE